MLSLFIVLLRFSESLARARIKCINRKPCMVRPTLIDMNPIELKYYPFITSLNKCTGSGNVLSPKIYVPKEIKDVNIKAFKMITNKDEAKAITEHISYDLNANSMVQHVIRIKN